MKPVMKSMLFGAMLICLSSCYEDYIHDYEHPNMGFALTRQVRTVVADKNLIYVGVSIGGKREVDMSDWATFELAPELLDGLGLQLLPENYYVLSDPGTMRPRKQNLAVADVGITFTEEFYNDPGCTKNTYALPLRITGTSVRDEDNPSGAILKGGETAVIIIKYISGYSGTYYRVGSQVETDAGGNAVGDPVRYDDADLVRNPDCSLTTVSRYCVSRSGLGNSSDSGMRLHVTETESEEAYTVRLEPLDSRAEIIDASARYVLKGDYTFHTGDEVAPQFELEYTWSMEGRFYKVNEKLVLRQWPEFDLKVEVF